jgi:LysR family nitrogen assimilation transcriptional regulator
MNAIGTAPNITLEADGLNAILSLVKEGLGHAVLPSYTLSNFGEREQLMPRRIKSPRITSALSLVRPTRRPITQTQKVAFKIVNAMVTQAVKAYR